MIQRILFTALLMAVMTLSACHKDEDDLFSKARVTLITPDSVDITNIQAEARLTNVNTRQVITSTSFSGATLTVQTLRGIYEISVEGVATCGTGDKRQFRATTDYADLSSKDNNELSLTIIYLD